MDEGSGPNHFRPRLAVPGTMEGVSTLAGYADTSGHGRVRFVISLTKNDDKMRFRLLRAIESGL